MKNNIYYLVFLCFIIQACNNDNTILWNDSKQVNSQGDDTIAINKILNTVAKNEFANADSNLYYLKTAEEWSTRILYEKGYAYALFLHGNLLYDENSYREALDYYSRALNLSEKMNFVLLKAKCIERMASVNLTLGDDHLSLKLYYESLPLFEQTKNKEGIAKVYNIIGLYKGAQKEYDSAETYYREAMKINEEIGNKAGLVHNRGNLGYLYEKTGKLSQAANIYNELIDYLVKAGDSQNLPVIYYNFSSLYEKKDQPDTALLYLEKALAICEKTRDTSLMSTLYGSMGEIFLGHHRYDSAILLFNKSIACSKATGDMETEAQATKLLVELDTLKGEYRKAVRRFDRLLLLNDSVFSRKTRHDLKTSELQYENQKKTNFIELQNLQLQSAKRQKLIFILLFIFSLLSVLFLFVLILFAIKNNRKKRKLLDEELKVKELEIVNSINTEEIKNLRIKKIEQDLKIKEREQISSALALEQKNELLCLISKKFNEAMLGSGSISIADLNGLVSAIKTQVRVSSDPDLFNQKFNQLHHEFYANLQRVHPTLTKTELRFCAYLKLNLSGSQITSLQSITQEAIRKTRHRIRKKMNLTPKESLEEYISRF